MSQYIQKVQNHGSAIGESIGIFMEKALQEKLSEVADLYGCHYITSGIRTAKSGSQSKKLLISDNYGNQYNIDGIFTNENMQPLILFESKYLRYTKHNRDKGSWICTAHAAVRRRYHSIRSSIAVLAGNWSCSSKAMMRSNDINLFFIPFEFICELLQALDIDFIWGEKEKEKASEAWYKYNLLREEQKVTIGRRMVASIEDSLISLIQNILDESIERNIKKIVIEIVSSLGEIKNFEFDALGDALDFLMQEDLKKIFVITDSLSLFDPPPTFEDSINTRNP